MGRAIVILANATLELSMQHMLAIAHPWSRFSRRGEKQRKTGSGKGQHWLMEVLEATRGCSTVEDIMKSNVVSIRTVRTLAGKANHVASLVCVWRPFLSEHSTRQGPCPGFNTSDPLYCGSKPSFRAETVHSASRFWHQSTETVPRSSESSATRRCSDSRGMRQLSQFTMSRL